MYNKLKQKIETARLNRDTTTLLFYSTFLGDIEKLAKGNVQNLKAQAAKGVNNKQSLDELVVTVGAQWRKAMESNMVLAAQKDLPLLEEQMKKELSLLEEILPKMLTKEELEGIIKGYLVIVPKAALGEIMKHLKTYHSGQYDGKVASQIIGKLSK